MENSDNVEITTLLGGNSIFILLFPYVILILALFNIVRCIIANRCDDIMNDSDESDKTKIHDIERSVCSTEIVRYKVAHV